MVKTLVAELLNDLGCHCIEAARGFLGKQDRDYKSVIAWGAHAGPQRQDKKGEDNALLVLQMASGGVAHCELSWTTLGGLDLRNEIHGSEGSIFTDVTRQTPIASFTTKSSGYVVEKADIDFGWTRPLPEEAFAHGYQAEMRHFVECVRDGVELRATCPKTATSVLHPRCRLSLYEINAAGLNLSIELSDNRAAYVRRRQAPAQDSVWPDCARTGR